jgi:hypothetical protein
MFKHEEDYVIAAFMTVLIVMLALSVFERSSDTEACLKRGGIPKTTRYDGVICFAPETLR